MKISSQKLLTSFILILLSGYLLAAPIDDQRRNQAKRIHDRLAGVPASNSVIDQMELLLAIDPSGKTAAAKALENPAFYNVTLKNFVTPWTNEEETVFAPLNDYTATVIGMIRDDIDFRQILHGDIIYIGNSSSLGISGYSNSNNNHYEELEALGPIVGDLADPSILRGPPQGVTQSSTTSLPVFATAGVVTTRAGARAFFIDGTNRAMFRFTLKNHLCTDLEPLKDISRTPDKVRQDVSRSPGGDSRIYLNNCVGCHAGMDGMSGAYAYYNYNNGTGRLDYTAGSVQPKHLINPDNFKPGNIMTDDSWINYWRNGQNGVLASRDGSRGWGHAGEILDAKGNATGNGAKSLGIELANSKAFAQCQVDKVFETVCLRNPNDLAADIAERNNIVDDFVTGGYKMKQVFGDVGAWCKGS
jgi:hypothetical protein